MSPQFPAAPPGFLQADSVRPPPGVVGEFSLGMEQNSSKSKVSICL
ncbi:MAG: hypothetical protein R3C26_04855 [Calditrichia bacterium]